jgi:hypothetical protein
LCDARCVELVDVSSLEERRDDGRHATEVTDDVLLGLHHDDAAVGLLGWHGGQVGRRILGIAVPDQPQHWGVRVDCLGVLGRYDAPWNVTAHGGALLCLENAVVG